MGEVPMLGQVAVTRRHLHREESPQDTCGVLQGVLRQLRSWWTALVNGLSTRRHLRRHRGDSPKTPAEYFKEFFDNLGLGGPPLSMGSQPGAIFAVIRETIHRRPPQLLLEELFLGDMKAVEPETSH